MGTHTWDKNGKGVGGWGYRLEIITKGGGGRWSGMQTRNTSGGGGWDKLQILTEGAQT